MVQHVERVKGQLDFMRTCLHIMIECKGRFIDLSRSLYLRNIIRNSKNSYII